MKIRDALHAIQVMGVDTAPFIYFTENNPHYFDLVEAIFNYVEKQDLSIIVASLTFTEVLMKPIQANNKKLQYNYKELLLNTKNVLSIALDNKIAIKAAELRATYNLKTPDALHLATAIISGADAFLTNDAGFKRVTDITILILDELEL